MKVDYVNITEVIDSRLQDLRRRRQRASPSDSRYVLRMYATFTTENYYPLSPTRSTYERLRSETRKPFPDDVRRMPTTYVQDLVATMTHPWSDRSNLTTLIKKKIAMLAGSNICSNRKAAPQGQTQTKTTGAFKLFVS